MGEGERGEGGGEGGREREREREREGERKQLTNHMITSCTKEFSSIAGLCGMKLGTSCAFHYKYCPD